MNVTTESAGVSLCKSLQPTTSADLARCGLDHLGNLSNVDLNDSLEMDSNTTPNGAIGNAEDLFPKWSLSQHSKYWISNNDFKTLAACIPLKGSYNKAFNSSVALKAIAKPELSAHGQPTQITDPYQFAAITAALAHKATNSITRQNNGSILWLTGREHTILNHLIEGLSVRAIAEHINRSPHTVHDHVKNLHRKLGASSRGQLIAIATGHHTTKTDARLQQPRILPSLLQSTNQSYPTNETNYSFQSTQQSDQVQQSPALTNLV